MAPLPYGRGAILFGGGTTLRMRSFGYSLRIDFVGKTDKTTYSLLQGQLLQISLHGICGVYTFQTLHSHICIYSHVRP